jgi:hypothetical protein
MVMRCIEEVSLGCEIWTQLRMLHPQLSVNAAQNRMMKPYAEWHNNIMRPLIQRLKAVAPAYSTLKVFGGGVKDLSAWDYPSNKRRTRERTAAMQDAEKNLDGIWARYDAHLRANGIRRCMRGVRV